MTMEKTTSKIYYGWYIVGVCFITMAMIGGIGYIVGFTGLLFYLLGARRRAGAGRGEG